MSMNSFVNPSPFIYLNRLYTTYYNQSMKGEGLTCVSFEAGQKRMTQGAESSGTGSLQTCLLCPFSLQTQ